MTGRFSVPSFNASTSKTARAQQGANPPAAFSCSLLILQRLHNLSDERLQYQVTDRLSFMRFLG
ncbi:MAG: transposase [Betaproteobacteria bacterium]|nr:transposase [Candidatus Dechloromonas phosphorivorans]